MFADDGWVDDVKGPQISLRPLVNAGAHDKQKLVGKWRGEQVRRAVRPVLRPYLKNALYGGPEKR